MSKPVAIVGLGALGSAFAVLLAEKEIPVTGVVHNAQHRQAILENGLTMREGEAISRIHLRVAAELPEGENWGLVIVLVKAYDTASVAKEIAGKIVPSTPVLTLQNGIGNAEALSRVFASQQILAGATTFGALLESPGVVRLTGRGECEIGAWHTSAESNAHSAKQVLDRAGLRCTVTREIASALWKKLAVSAAINPLTALLHVPNGAITNISGLQKIIAGACEEVWAVAARQGIALPTPPELVAEVRRVCELTASNISSMRRDLEQGRRTEIDAINGAVVRLGEQIGVRTPFNLALAALVDAAASHQN